MLLVFPFFGSPDLSKLVWFIFLDVDLPIAFLFAQGDFPVPFFSGCSFCFAACELGQHRISSVVLHVKNWFFSLQYCLGFRSVFFALALGGNSRELLFTYRWLLAHREPQDSCSSFLGSARPLRLARDFSGLSSAASTLLLSSFSAWALASCARAPARGFIFWCSVPVHWFVLRFPAHGLGSRSALPPIWSRVSVAPASVSYSRPALVLPPDLHYFAAAGVLL
jgi:hypothetical protein